MARDMTREGGTAAYNAGCEPDRWKGYALLGAISFALVGTGIAVGLKIASDSDEAPAPPRANIEEYAPYSGELAPASPLLNPGRLQQEALQTDLEYAEERVFFDGSSATVQACKDAAAALSAISVVPITGNCTPPTKP